MFDGAFDLSVFVAPLVAVTLARFGAVTAGRPGSKPRGICVGEILDCGASISELGMIGAWKPTICFSAW
jgi:hypothetical protein